MIWYCIQSNTKSIVTSESWVCKKLVGRPTAKIIDYTLKLSAVIKLAWLMVIEHTYLSREGRLGDELGRCRGEYAGLCKVSVGDDPEIHDVDR